MRHSPCHRAEDTARPATGKQLGTEMSSNGIFTNGCILGYDEIQHIKHLYTIHVWQITKRLLCNIFTMFTSYANRLHMDHFPVRFPFAATKPKHPYIAEENFKFLNCKALLNTTWVILRDHRSSNNPSGDNYLPTIYHGVHNGGPKLHLYHVVLKIQPQNMMNQ